MGCATRLRCEDIINARHPSAPANSTGHRTGNTIRVRAAQIFPDEIEDILDGALVDDFNIEAEDESPRQANHLSASDVVNCENTYQEIPPPGLSLFFHPCLPH